VTWGTSTLLSSSTAASFSSLSLTTALPVASGGTGLTTFTSGGALYATSTSALTTGTLPIGSGGTNFTGTPTAGGITYGSGTAFAFTAAGTAGQYLLSNAAGAPTWSSAGSNTQVLYNNSGSIAGSASLIFNGTGLTSGYFIPSSATAPTNGLFLPTTNTIGFSTNSSERLRIDATGLVGINTTTASTFVFNNLVVASGSAHAGIAIYGTGQTTLAFASGTSGTTSYQGYIQYSASGTDTMVFATAATERARISSAGGWSVGTTAAPGAGAIYATGNITANYSDGRLKNVSGTIENALDKVGKLKGVYYTINDTAKKYGYIDEAVQVGVLTQDVELVLPEVIKAAPFDLDENNNSKSGNNYKTVQYERIVPLLIEAIKELKAELDMLKGVK
jgi:hypothetical protein